MKLTTVYKLTKPDMTTYGGFRYDVGARYTFPGTGPLCAAGWSHAYLSPETAVLHNPIHANYVPARLWKCRGVIGAREGEMKVGCSAIELVREIPLPVATMEQQITYAIWCALAVYQDTRFVEWAEGWLSQEDRTGAAAWAAAWAAAVGPVPLVSFARHALQVSP